MIEFKRNKETGILEVWKDGKKAGEVITMGDEVDGNNREDKNDKQQGGMRKES